MESSDTAWRVIGLAIGLALVLTVFGVVAAVWIGSAGWLSWTLALSCLLIPSGAAYVVWLWMFGPWAGKGTR